MPGKRYIHAGCASFAFPCDVTVPTVRDFLDILQRLTPPRLAEDWDNVGLLVGDPGQDIRSVLVALDPALPLLDQARAGGHNLLLTHHPAIFRPLKALRTDTHGHVFALKLSPDGNVWGATVNKTAGDVEKFDDVVFPLVPQGGFPRSTDDKT